MPSIPTTVPVVVLSALTGAVLALGAQRVPAQPSGPESLAVTEAEQPAYTFQDGKLTARLLLDPASVGASAATMTRLTALSGAGAPEHTHDGDELVYVLSGTASARVGQTSYELSPGMAMRVPANTPHEFAAAEQEGALEVLVIYAPGGAEQRFTKGERVQGD